MYKKKLLTIFKASPTPTLVLQTDAPYYTIIEANIAYLDVTGTSEEDIIGKPFFEAFPANPEDVEAEGITYLRASLDNVVQTKERHKIDVHKYDIPIRGSEKFESRYWSPENTPVLNDQGEVEFILHTVFDVTNQVLSEADNRLILDNTGESFVLVDSYLNILNFNVQFEKNYSVIFNKKVVKGNSILDYVQPERKESVAANYRRVLKGETTEDKLKLPTGDNNYRFFDINYNPAIGADGFIYGVFASFIETTQENKAKEQYQSLVQTLEGVIWEANADTFSFSYVSPQSKQILGHSPSSWYEDDYFWVNHIHPDDRKKTVEFKHNETLKGKNHSSEYRLRKADGDYIWLRDMVTVIKQQGQPNLLRGLMIDITEQKIAEEASTFERRDKEALINSTDDMIWSVDKNLLLIAANKATLEGMKTNTGKTLKQGDHILSGLQNESAYLKEWEEFYTRALSGESFRVETHEPDPVGEPKYWYETSFNPIYNGVEAIGIACFSRNISGKRRTQYKLKAAEQKLRDIIEHSSNMFYQHDTQGVLTYLSPQSIRFLGYHPEDELREWTEFITDHPLNKKGEEITRKAIDTGIAQPPYELQLKRADGEIIWVEVNEAPLEKQGKVVGIVGALVNITDRKQYEEQLQLSEQRFKSLVQEGSDLIAILDQNGIYNYVSPNSESFLGISNDDLIGKDFFSFIHKEDKDRIKKILSNLSDGERKEIAPFRFKNANGNWGWLKTIITNMGGNASVGGFVVNSKDVTLQIENENKLKELSLVASKTTDLVTITDASGKITWVNDAFEALTGYSLKDVRGKEHSKLLNGPQTDSHTIQRIADALERHDTVEELVLNYAKDGTPYWLDITIDPIFDEAGNCTHHIAIKRDVTDRKNKEQEIRASLAEKETLLSEIHHRVKNNLAVVSGMMQLQAFDTHDKDLQAKLYDSIGRIQTMATVHELLYSSNSFSKLQFSETVEKLLTNISETLQSSCEVSLYQNCMPIQLNINQAIPASLIVNEVITNVYKYAFVGKKKGKLTFNLSQKDKHIHLEISDDGIGLPKNFGSLSQKSLGIRLIEVLTQQLDGNYTYKNNSSGENGTIFTLNFEKNEMKGVGNFL